MVGTRIMTISALRFSVAGFFHEGFPYENDEARPFPGTEGYRQDGAESCGGVCDYAGRGDCGEGWHKKAGTPHAEIHALRQAGDMARNADVYVTLEPCAHFGKTPPCADALVAAGVARVFVGMTDPNPLVCGKGIDILRAAGIEVYTGILEKECSRINEGFIKHVTTGLPFVILKSALTLDGKRLLRQGIPNG